MQHNILLLDNELLNRDLLGNHLKHNGYHVFPVEGCQDALEAITRNRFKLAVLSARFGEKAVGEVVDRLRKHDADALAFLLCSEHPDSESLRRLNAHDAIVKPFRLDEVSRKLRHAVEIINLREALRVSAGRIKKLESELRGFRSVEDEVRIPGLEELDESPPKQATDAPEKPARLRVELSDRKPPAAGNGEKPGVSGDEAIERIRRLDELRKDGVLTTDEFNRKKKELLKRI